MILQIQELLTKELPDIKLKKVKDSLLIEIPENLPQVVELLKSHPETQANYLSSITGADYIDFLECVYHFYSMPLKKGPIILRARTSRNNPVIPSLTPLYKGADFQEREIYDLFGISFSGHPHLKRIFMWDEFKGFPLRKDYVQENSDVLDETDSNWLKERNIKQ